MFGRKTFILVAAGAVAAPYVTSNWEKIKSSVTGAAFPTTKSYGTPAGANTYYASYNPAQSPTVVWPQADPAREETPIVDMTEAFRFDVIPSWVMSRWPRVSAGLPDEKYQGLRVPLITGVQPDDLAGSLTYYFTQSQKCAKLPSPAPRAIPVAPRRY